MGMAAVAWIEHVFGNLARSTDGLKERSTDTGIYCPPTRLWRNW